MGASDGEARLLQLSFCKRLLAYYQQVRNMGFFLEGQALCSANDWEEVKRKGDASIEKWDR